MKNNITIIILIFTFLLLSCTKKGSNSESRQFEKKITADALSKDGKEIKTQLKCYYVYFSITEKLFDEKGYFVKNEEGKDILVEAIVRSSVRNVLQEYSLDDFSSFDKRKIESEILNQAQNMNIELENDLEIRINDLFLDVTSE